MQECSNQNRSSPKFPLFNLTVTLASVGGTDPPNRLLRSSSGIKIPFRPWTTILSDQCRYKPYLDICFPNTSKLRCHVQPRKYLFYGWMPHDFTFTCSLRFALVRIPDDNRVVPDKHAQSTKYIAESLIMLLCLDLWIRHF